MSLIRQLWLLVIFITVITCSGSLVTSLWSHRHYLEDQLQIKNHDNAAALAISLSQQAGDMDTIQLLIAAQYDTGHYLRITLSGPDGKSLVNLAGKAPPVTAPVWFVRLLPIQSAPGRAQVSAGWQQMGSIEVVSHSAFAHGVLWSSAVRLTLLLTLVGLVAGLCGTLIVRRTVTPLSGLVQQARALSERRFIKSEPSSVPELKSLTQAMNGMVDRVQGQFAEHAATVERLRHAATTDAVTGVANREEFQNLLEDILSDPQLSGTFMMIRVRDLQRLNQELGHAQTDRKLKDMADKLVAFSAATTGSACGRLNGSDFAVVLPGRKASPEILASLTANLGTSGAPGSTRLQPAVGATALVTGITTGRLLANADVALAAAEAGEHGFALLDEQSAATDMAGQNDWRKDLQETLARRQIVGRLRPVTGPGGEILHQQVDIHISWGLDDAYHPPSDWMPYAIRTGMASAIEEIAIEQCVQMAATATTDLALRLSEPTLRDASVLAHLAGLLLGNPAAAKRLYIEIPESLVFRDPGFGVDLGQTLRRTGARIGLADAGVYFSRIPAMPSLQLDHIKVAAALSGARNTAEQAYLAGIISMAHGMGIRAYLGSVPGVDGRSAMTAAGADGVIAEGGHA